ncbi:hypothetical protein [Streptomyces sp. bgisy022]
MAPHGGAQLPRRRIVVTVAGPVKVTASWLDNRRVDEITGEPGEQQQQ